MNSRGLLRPLTPLYAAATALRNAAYDRSLLRVHKLPVPVVSVGNLSVGGTGKTPLVATLARLLAASGKSPIILSRGYGRSSSSIARVDAAGTAAQFGDEPLLLARTGFPVYVGGDRYRAGRLALEQSALTSTTFFLLDDGFQHRRLARDVDIVLVSAHVLRDSLLPAGNLREPLGSLSRAQVVVLREEDAALAPQFLQYIGDGVAPPRLWTVRRSLDAATLATATGPAIAFAGIARPQDFFSALRARGVELAAALPFSDHHAYAFRDITRILAALKGASARTLVTTEKDFVRLDARARSALQSAAPLVAVPLVTELAAPELYLRQIEELCVRQF